MSQASATQEDPYQFGQENKLTTNEEKRERRFEQHAHKPLYGRTQSAIAEHLKEKATGCKREFVEPARTVEEQCTAIIGNTPWPYGVCWLCGFPVGEQTANGSTMLQYIAELMGIQCVFVNPLSARWDKQTCEHVNPINVAGSEFLNKSATGYLELNQILNIRMEYEGAHDLCNILKNEGYMITLENGEVVASFKGLAVAKWQIDAWPIFLLDGSMNGPSLSSVICFVRTNSGSNEIQKVFLKSPIHGYLFLKVLEKMTENQRDVIFTKLQPILTDELAAVTIVNGKIQTPPPPESTGNINKDAAGFFKSYDMRRKKNPTVNFIHTVNSITSIKRIEDTVKTVVGEWKKAIKSAMFRRMHIFVDYIKEVDGLVDELLWPLMKSSTQQQVTLYKGNPNMTYQQLSALLQRKLIELKTSNPRAYDRIAVLVLTKEERNIAHAKHLNEWNIDEVSKKGRLTQRDKLPQPVPGLPVITSLGEYTEPPIFKFAVLEQQKRSEMEIALKAVSGSLYNEKFMSELQAIVDTGDTTAAAAEKLITTAEDKTCARTGNNNSGSMSGVSQPATSRNSPSAASSASAAAINFNFSRAVPVDMSKLARQQAEYQAQQAEQLARQQAQQAFQLSQQQAQQQAFQLAQQQAQQQAFQLAQPQPQEDSDTKKRKKAPKTGNNNGTNPGLAMTTNNNNNMSKRRKTTSGTQKREKVFARRTPGGGHKLRNHRNHRTRKQKKNRKTRKNKKLTKRF